MSRAYLSHSELWSGRRRLRAGRVPDFRRSKIPESFLQERTSSLAISQWFFGERSLWALFTYKYAFLSRRFVCVCVCVCVSLSLSLSLSRFERDDPSSKAFSSEHDATKPHFLLSSPLQRADRRGPKPSSKGPPLIKFLFSPWNSVSHPSVSLRAPLVTFYAKT